MNQTDLKLYEAVNQILAQIGGLLGRAKEAEDKDVFVSQHLAQLSGTVSHLDELFALWRRQALTHGVSPHICNQIAEGLDFCKQALGIIPRAGH